MKRRPASRTFQNEFNRSMLRKTDNFKEIMIVFSMLLTSSSIWVVDSLLFKGAILLLLLGELAYYIKTTKKTKARKPQPSSFEFNALRVYMELIPLSSLRFALILGFGDSLIPFGFSVLAESLINFGFPYCSNLVKICCFSNFFLWNMTLYILKGETSMTNAVVHLALSYLPSFLNEKKNSRLFEEFQNFFKKSKEAEKLHRMQENISFPMFIVELSDEFKLQWANIEGKHLQKRCGCAQTFPQLFSEEYEPLIKEALQNIDDFLPKFNSCVFPLNISKNKRSETLLQYSNSRSSRSHSNLIPSVDFNITHSFCEFYCEFLAKVVQEGPTPRLFVTVVEVTLMNETLGILQEIFNKNKKFLPSLSEDALQKYSNGYKSLSSAQGISLLNKIEISKMTSFNFEEVLRCPSPFGARTLEFEGIPFENKFSMMDAALTAFLSIANSGCLPKDRLLCFDFIDQFSEKVYGSFDAMEQVLSLLVRILVLEGEAQRLYCQILLDASSQNANSPLSYNSMACSFDEMSNLGVSSLEMTPQLGGFGSKKSSQHHSICSGLMVSGNSKPMHDTARFELAATITDKVNTHLFSKQKENQQNLVTDYLKKGGEIELLRLSKLNLPSLLKQIKGRLSVKKNLAKNRLIVTLTVNYKIAHRSPASINLKKSCFSFVNEDSNDPNVLVSYQNLTVLWKESRRNTHVLKIDTSEIGGTRLSRYSTIKNLTSFFQGLNTGNFEKKVKDLEAKNLASKNKVKKNIKETPFARGAPKPVKRINIEKFFQREKGLSRMSIVMEHPVLEEAASVMAITSREKKTDDFPESEGSVNLNQPSIKLVDTENLIKSTPSTNSKISKSRMNVINQIRSLESVSKSLKPLSGKSTIVSAMKPPKGGESEFLSSREVKILSIIKKRRNKFSYGFEDWDLSDIQDAKFVKEYIESVAEALFARVKLKDCLPKESNEASIKSNGNPAYLWSNPKGIFTPKLQKANRPSIRFPASQQSFLLYDNSAKATHG